MLPVGAPGRIRKGSGDLRLTLESGTDAGDFAEVTFDEGSDETNNELRAISRPPSLP